VRVPGSFRTKLVVAFVALAVVTAAVMLHQAWRRARAAQLEDLRVLLRTTTSTIAPEVDGDAHERLDPKAPGVLADPEFLRLRALAARARAANPRVKEVYTISTSGRSAGTSGKGRIVLSETDAEVGRDYDYARFPAMVRCLTQGEPTADEDVSVDEYGASLSGYAPIRNAAGKVVGLLGVDVDGTTVQEMRSQLLGLLALGSLGAVLAAGALGWAFARRISRPVQLLASATDRVAAGDYDTRVHWESGDEFGRLSGHFNRMVEGLEERQRMRQAMQVAMEIQQHLLPEAPPSLEGVDVSGFSDYCDETGGDYFDYPRTWQVPGKRLALTVGDVTGHGIGAALLMSTGRAVLRSHAQRDVPPGELVGIVNHHLAEDAAAGKFMTLYYGVLDPGAGTLVYANAGQGGCFVVRADGKIETMAACGPPAGVVDGLSFVEGRVEGLRQGDVVVLGTDGIWETVDAKGELFEMERFEAVARANASRSAKEIADAIRAAVETHRGTGPQTDDVTLVVAKLVAPPPS
jgi:serine phosphatase RsbU (regulator of sigma subunit)